MSKSRILYLELDDFKSYRGHVKVGPFKDFTCIVGPNGAGKSNLLDALSVVVSPSASTIRGVLLKDFINRESNAQHCAVTLVMGTEQLAASHLSSFSGADQEESGAGLPCKVILTRRIDEANVSSFEVDGKRVSKEQYAQTLSQYNIGTRIQNFIVFQHEVEDLRQKNPKELTEMIEDVSESALLKPEYEKRKKELDNANENLTKASSAKRSAAIESNQMRLIAKDVEHFYAIEQQHKTEKVQLALAELFYVESTLNQQKNELLRFHGTLDQLQLGIPTEAQIRSMKQEYINQHKTYVDELKKSRTLTENYRSKLCSLERLKASVEYLNHQQEIEKGQLAGVMKSVSSHNAEVKRLQSQKSRYELLLKELDSEKEKDTEKLMASMSHLTKKDYEEYQRLKDEVESLTVTQRDQQETLKRQLEMVNRALDQWKAEQESAELRRKEHSDSMARLQQQRTEIKKRKEELLHTAKTLEGEIIAANKAEGLTKKRYSEREANLFKIQEQLRDLRQAKEVDRHHHRMMEVIETLKSIFHIRGRLVDLCHIPDDSYRVGVTVALGKNLEALVVDTTETAIACIQYLKEHRLPSMIFLPLNGVAGTEVSDRLRTFGGSCKPVVDVLSYHPELENVIRYALGESLVCDTVQEARRIAFGNIDGKRYKVITRDGTVLMKNGAIQGGLASIEARAKRWDDKKYEELRATRDHLLQEAMREGEAELAKIHLSIRDLTSRLEFCHERQKVIDEELDKNNQSHHHLAQDEKNVVEENKVKSKVEAYQRQKSEIMCSIEALHKEIKTIEEKTFASLQTRVKISELIELERSETQLAEERAQRRQQMVIVIHKLHSAIELEEKRCGGNQASVELKASFDHRTTEIKSIEDQIHRLEGQCETLRESSGAIKKGLSTKRDALDKLQDKIRQASTSSETELHRLALARKGGAGLEAVCENLRQRRLNVIQRCQMEGIELPLRPVNSSSPASKVGAKRPRTEDEKNPSSSSVRNSEKSLESKTGAGHKDSARLVTMLTESEPFSLREETTLSETSTASSSPSSSSSFSPSHSGEGDENRDGAMVVVDFSLLSAALRQTASSREGVDSFRKEAIRSIEKLAVEMEHLAPQIKAASRLSLAEGRIEECGSQVELAREQVRKAHASFHDVRVRRTRQFKEIFEKLALQVDRIYKELTFGTRQHGTPGSAYLSLEDAEEPYLGGTAYHVTPPLKRFMPMELLSGGERTMAALALLFSIHAVSPVPFFILDEVDAALDSANVDKLSRFLRKRSEECQFVVVSHKDLLYGCADVLVGVTKEMKDVSRVLSLDLRGYPS